jgi:GDP-L-fucose synthase
MKIFLTGGNGFIGKNIIEKLGERHEIVAPRSSELDLLDQKAVNEYLSQNRPDVVIHAASVGLNLGQDGEQSILEKNLRMYFNLVNASKSYKKLIVLGSGAEYDKSHDIIDVREDDSDSRIPKELYAFSKYIMSQFARRQDNIIHLRLFGVFGPYEDYSRRFISSAICMALSDLPVTIKQNVIFDYLYIDDLVAILDKFIQQESFEHRIYNVGRGVKCDLHSIAELILEATDKKLPINILHEGLNNEYTCNIDRLAKEFPDIGFTDMKESIQALVAYYRKTLPSIDKNIFQ